MQSIFAHRGVSSLAIENSEQAIQLCAQYGLKAVEVDVQLLADNTAVIFHDADFKRLAQIDRQLKTLTLQELDAITLKMPHKDNQSVLTLSELIDIIKRLDLVVNIELKRFGQSCDAYVQNIVQPLIKELPINKLLFSSFDFELLEAIRAYCTHSKIAVLSDHFDEQVLAFIQKISAQACHLKDAILNIEDIKNFKAHGFFVGAFTVNDNKRYQQLMQAGVDYVFSDVPHLLSME
ncbi:glycerophosphodiester phosphodiesterase [Marinicellulosiphila megalodicopiae]|uniref:glycerophosphodiester phosphodiesterase n=1 Tax=Marinicellulosiphila megalodicopiae TaxID=2724896 RepID=UPI003BAEEE44